MPIFGRNNTPKPAPTPDPKAPQAATAVVPDPKAPVAPIEDPRFAQLADGINGLRETVSRFVDAQARPGVPASAPALPAIKDITDEEYDSALEEGGAAARKAITVRQAANEERLRRQFQQQIDQVQGPGLAAINDLTTRQLLGDNELYKTDPVIKKDVDAQLAQLKAGGLLITPEAVQYVTSKVIGDHTPRLMKEQQEKLVRAQREEVAVRPNERGRTSGHQQREQKENDKQTPYDLTPDADKLLASRRHGQGTDADGFAKSLPARDRPSGMGTKSRERYNYATWDEMMEAYEEAQREYEEEQLPQYFGRR